MPEVNGANQKMKNRVEWIDVLRGFAMICIVLGHSLDPGPLRTWLYSFHVPLFFFLSGLLFSNRNNPIDFVKKQIRTTLVPYWIFGLISVFIYAILGQFAASALGKSDRVPDLPVDLLGLIYGSAQNGQLDANMPLWFLPALFSMQVVFYFLSFALGKIKTNWNIKCAIVCAAFALIGWLYNDIISGIPLPFGINTVFCMIPFFCIGYWVSKGRKPAELNFKVSRAALFVSFGVMLIGCFAAYLNSFGGITDYVTNSYRNYLLFYLSALCQGYFFVVLAIRVYPFSILKTIGKSTLSILVMHKYPIVLAQTILALIQVPAYLSLSNPVVGIAVAAIAIGLCLLAEKIILRFAPWSLGK